MAIKQRIPVTTLPRTILDLAAILPVEAVEGAIREAEFHHRLRLQDLHALLARYPGRRGAKTLRTCSAVLTTDLAAGSAAGSRFGSPHCSPRIDLPVPRLNVVLELDGGWVEADCLCATNE
jgi:hypothetical protein